MKVPQQTRIFFFCALPCEAKPIVGHFGLKKDMTLEEFPVYKNAQYSLTVTGAGKSAMAAGTAYTLALVAGFKHRILINIGIAGHKHYSLGEIFIAEKISDTDTGRNYYPQLVYAVPCPTESIGTVAKAHAHHYPCDYLYDMEASAFYETAVRFTSCELIQCLKVISDNEASPLQNIEAKQVSRWIEGSMPTLETLIETMICSAKLIESFEPKFYAQAIEKWHFTHSERIKLHQTLSRWNVLMNGIEPNIEQTHLHKGKDVIHWLENELHSVDFDLAQK